MLFGELLRSALRSLAANRLRTILTLLGMIIGVAAVVAMISLGEGARAQVQQSIQAMGTNLLFVRPGQEQRGPVRSGTVSTLIDADVTAIAEVPGVTAAVPENARGAQIKYYANNTNSSVVGTTPAYLAARNFTMAQGEFINEADVRGRRRVAVLGATVAKTLFNALDPLGERIQIKGLSFTVVGVFAEKGDAGWMNPDEQIVIPLPTWQQGIFGSGGLASITVAVRDEAAMAQVQDDVTRLLRVRHRIAPGESDDFNIRSQTEMLQTMNEVTGVFTALLGGVAAVSLLVGGIGIMNIMLVSVRERTREIGIRKAVGARPRDILLQFLFEAVLVSAVGGAAGIAAGYGLSAGFAYFSGWVTIVPAYAVILSVATSVAIGIVFGVWPAREAARLNPVDALRYE